MCVCVCVCGCVCVCVCVCGYELGIPKIMEVRKGSEEEGRASRGQVYEVKLRR